MIREYSYIIFNDLVDFKFIKNDLCNYECFCSCCHVAPKEINMYRKGA